MNVAQPEAAAHRHSLLGAALADRAVAAAVARDALHLAREGLADLTEPEAIVAPTHVRGAARDALARGETHYTVRPGVPELRAVIAAASTQDGFPATVESTIVTNGGAEALYIALQATVRRGEQVLIAGPAVPTLPVLLNFIGARVTRLPRVPEALPDDAAVLLLADPSPVTGVAAAPGEIERLVREAGERGMQVIIDRSVAACRYDGSRPAFADPDLGRQLLTIGSCSVSHGMAGWRVGWLTAPPTRISALRELKQAMSICTTAVSQFAALAALAGPREWLDARREEFCRRRDDAIALLGEASLPVVLPDAWSSLLIDTRALDPDDREVVRRLREQHHVLADAGSRFGVETAGHLRIDLASPVEALERGLDHILALGKRGRT